MTDFDRRTIEEFRAAGGRPGGTLAGIPLVLIHHIGARSGAQHVTPLAYSIQGDCIAIAASNGGSPTHPAWYHNLKANPAITVDLGTERFRATAEEQLGPAREALWSNLAAEFPDLAKFAATTDRPIPLLLLRRTATARPPGASFPDVTPARLPAAARPAGTVPPSPARLPARPARPPATSGPMT